MKALDPGIEQPGTLAQPGNSERSPAVMFLLSD